MAIPGVWRPPTIWRRQFLGRPGLPRLPPGHSDRAQPDSDSRLRRIRNDRPVAVDRAAHSRQPAGDAALADSLLPALAGRTAERLVLELCLQPDGPSARAPGPDLLRPAADTPLIGAATSHRTTLTA